MVKVGVLVGETKTHFLLRHRAEWIPVRKEAFEENERNFARLKGRKVQISVFEGSLPKVTMLPQSANLGTLTGDQGSESDQEEAALTSLDAATTRQVRLNLELLQDVVALSSLSSTPDRSRQYSTQRLPGLQEDLDAVFSQADSTTETETVHEAAEACKYLISSMEFGLKDMKVVCSDCKVATAQVQLSCSHNLCSECCRELVVYTSGSELKALRCPSCYHNLTTTDARIILLEKYHLLQKQMKYTQLLAPSS